MRSLSLHPPPPPRLVGQPGCMVLGALGEQTRAQPGLGVSPDPASCLANRCFSAGRRDHSRSQPSPPSCSLQSSGAWRWGGGEEGRGQGCHRPRALFWVEAGWKGCWDLRIPQVPPESFVWVAGSRKLPTLGKCLPMQGWVGPASTSPAEGYTQAGCSAATGEGSRWRGGRILSAPDSVSPIGYKRMLLGWWQRTGRRADKTDHMGFDQHLWVPTNAWAPEVLVS